MSQEQLEQKKTIFSSSGLTTAVSAKATESLVNKASEIGNKVRVVYGANEGYFPLSGKTVGDVRKGVKNHFSLPGDVKAQVDGKEVNDDYILAPCQNLEFSHSAGVKGIFLKNNL